MSEIDDILGLGDSQETFKDQGDAFDVFINGPRLGAKTFVDVTGRTKSTTFVITCLERRHHLLPCTAHHVTMHNENLHRLAG
jgi:hypothetical protein